MSCADFLVRTRSSDSDAGTPAPHNSLPAGPAWRSDWWHRCRHDCKQFYLLMVLLFADGRAAAGVGARKRCRAARKHNARYRLDDWVLATSQRLSRVLSACEWPSARVSEWVVSRPTLQIIAHFGDESIALVPTTRRTVARENYKKTNSEQKRPYSNKPVITGRSRIGPRPLSTANPATWNALSPQLRDISMSLSFRHSLK